MHYFCTLNAWTETWFGGEEWSCGQGEVNWLVRSGGWAGAELRRADAGMESSDALLLRQDPAARADLSLLLSTLFCAGTLHHG